MQNWLIRRNFNETLKMLRWQESRRRMNSSESNLNLSCLLNRSRRRKRIKRGLLLERRSLRLRQLRVLGVARSKMRKKMMEVIHS